MIEVNLFNIVGLAVIGVMIAFWYEPLQSTKRYLIDLLPFSSLTGKVFNCSKCSSFILSFAIYWDITAAALCAFIAYVINFIIDYIQSWYEG